MECWGKDVCAISQLAILDNGAFTVKYGWADSNEPKGSMPNCTAKINKTMQVFTGDEIDSIQNTSQLHFLRPFDRGYLVNWNVEKEVEIPSYQT